MQRRMIKGEECLHGNGRFLQAFFCEAPVSDFCKTDKV